MGKSWKSLFHLWLQVPKSPQQGGVPTLNQPLRKLRHQRLDQPQQPRQQPHGRQDQPRAPEADGDRDGGHLRSGRQREVLSGTWGHGLALWHQDPCGLWTKFSKDLKTARSSSPYQIGSKVQHQFGGQWGLSRSTGMGVHFAIWWFTFLKYKIWSSLS